MRIGGKRISLCRAEASLEDEQSSASPVIGIDPYYLEHHIYNQHFARTRIPDKEWR